MVAPFFSAAKGCQKVLYTGGGGSMTCRLYRSRAARGCLHVFQVDFDGWMIFRKYQLQKMSKQLQYHETNPNSSNSTTSVSFLFASFSYRNFCTRSLTCFLVSFESIGPKNSLVTSAFSVGSNVIICVNVHGRIHLQKRVLLGHQEKSNRGNWCFGLYKGIIRSSFTWRI